MELIIKCLKKDLEKFADNSLVVFMKLAELVGVMLLATLLILLILVGIFLYVTWAEQLIISGRWGYLTALIIFTIFLFTSVAGVDWTTYKKCEEKN